MTKKYWSILLVVTLLLFTIAGVTVLAQTSAGFDLSWHVLGNGGGVSNSSSYRISGTIGQHLASPPAADSATYAVSGGYWVVGSGVTPIYLPALMNR